LAEGAVAPLIEAAGLEEILPARAAAFAVVSVYLGIDLLTHLDPGQDRAEGLFAAADRLVPLIGALAGGSG
jgi:hypothetical protein